MLHKLIISLTIIFKTLILNYPYNIKVMICRKEITKSHKAKYGLIKYHTKLNIFS